MKKCITNDFINIFAFPECNRKQWAHQREKLKSTKTDNIYKILRLLYFSVVFFALGFSGANQSNNSVWTVISKKKSLKGNYDFDFSYISPFFFFFSYFFPATKRAKCLYKDTNFPQKCARRNWRNTTNQQRVHKHFRTLENIMQCNAMISIENKDLQRK